MSKVAVVGGGLVGSILALMYARAGIEVRLLEAKPPSANSELAFDVRASAISLGSAAILAQHHLWQGFVEKATPILQVQVSDRGHFMGNIIDHQRHGVDALGYICENHHLFIALNQAIAGEANITLHQPVAVDGVRFTRKGAELALGESTLAVDLVVIADGAASKLRGGLGIGVEQVDYQQSALVTTIAVSEPHQQVAFERFTKNGPLALLPLSTFNGQHRMAVVWTLPGADQEHMLNASDADFIAQLQAQSGYRAGRITQVGQRQAYPLCSVMAKEQIRPNVAIVGNAAHFLHPVAGQGLNLALRDCDALVKHTLKAASLGDVAGLQAYAQARAPDQYQIERLTHSLVSLFSSANGGIAVGRQLGLAALNAIPVAGKLLGRQLMGYR